MENIPSDVSAVLARLSAILGFAFSLETLTRYVEQERGKFLKIEDNRLLHSADGLCLSLADADLIYLFSGLDRRIRMFVLLHEIAHILLGHAPHYPVRLAEYQQLHDQRFGLNRNSADESILSDEQQEDAAEVLALLLWQRVNAHLSSHPFVQEIW